MRPLTPALAFGLLLALARSEPAAGEAAVLTPISLVPRSVSVTANGEVTAGVDRVVLGEFVAEIAGHSFKTTRMYVLGDAYVEAHFEFQIPREVPLGSAVVLRRTQFPFDLRWETAEAAFEARLRQPSYGYGAAIARVTSALLGATTTVPFDVVTLDPQDVVVGPAYPGDTVGYDVRMACKQTCAIESVTLDLSLLTTHAAVASLACKADLTGDGVVNFADLAKMKSVFFKTCTP